MSSVNRMESVVRLYVVPLTLEEAKTFVTAHHRHHKPPVGHRFSLGAADQGGELHGVVIVGRPVARMSGNIRDVAEVTRLATDGTPNACSLLYGAAARTCRAMGFRRLQTYILATENGSSLRASGWTMDGFVTGREWRHTHGVRNNDHPTTDKTRWCVDFSRPLLPELR